MSFSTDSEVSMSSMRFSIMGILSAMVEFWSFNFNLFEFQGVPKYILIQIVFHN